MNTFKYILTVFVLALLFSSCGHNHKEGDGHDHSHDHSSHSESDDHGSQDEGHGEHGDCLLYTSPSPRDATLSRMPSSA